jgi:hypothetical protein
MEAMMSNIDACINCEHYDNVCDGYGLCKRDAIEIMVVADYEPTKNYAYCKRDKNENSVSNV